MLRVGILTFQETRNYGAELQAFALQKSLDQFNCLCEIIDYRCERIFNSERPVLSSDQKGFKRLIGFAFRHIFEQCCWNKFRKFESNNIRLSSVKYDRSSIATANDEYDCFIVGSDQVWNMDITGGDTTFFLDFVTDNDKKNSYAASFGYSKIPEAFVADTKKNLDCFSMLLVRERRGIEIIEELIHKSSALVLDPTLLLPDKEWIDLSLRSKLNFSGRKGYVFLYQIDLKNMIVLNFIRRIAQRDNLKILCCTQGLHHVHGVKYIHDASPEDFLNLIYHARYVITGSFHALCFSMIFEKEFFYFCSVPNRTSRQYSLMDLTNLRDREIIDGRCKKTAPIDYAPVHKILDRERQHSIDLLSQILSQYE